MKELIRVRVQYASRQQCCKTHKRSLPFFFQCFVHVKWSEDLVWNVCTIYSHVAVCRFCAVRYLIISCFSLFIYNYLTNVLYEWYSFCVFFVLYFCFLFCVFCVSVLFCVLFLLLYIAVTYFCTCLLTAATGWKSDSVNKYRIISVRIFYPHLLNPGTKSLRSSASWIGIAFFSLHQHRRLDNRTISPVKRKSRPDVKFCPQMGHFRGSQLPNGFARAHTH